jgi:putative endonuclease
MDVETSRCKRDLSEQKSYPASDRSDFRSEKLPAESFFIYKSRMYFIVYVLFSNTVQKFYCGQTDDFRLRLSRHNSGMVKSTKNGLPWTMIWTINVTTRKEALIPEKRIKKRGVLHIIIGLYLRIQKLSIIDG